MPVEIRLPQLGESIHEGTIARWLKKPGDRVEKYEALVEITTDKVNVEMPSPVAGVLRELLAAEGDTRPVGSPIALMETEAAVVSAGQPAQAVARGPAGSDESPVAERVPAVAPAGRTAGAARLSPLVQRLASEHQIPMAVLETLPGTGAANR
jgi:2-oxoisovalerate dehydrogenase E2 component (dihydrolipoyl transacylase)